MSNATFHELSLPGSASGFCSCPTFPGESGASGQRVHEPDEDDRDVDADAEPRATSANAATRSDRSGRA